MNVKPMGVGFCGVVCAAVLFASIPREHVLGAFATSLNGRTRSQRHNTGLALKRLVGATILPGATFSFNRRVGSFSRDEGYRKAPVSYNGQLISDWGGGVCQTSTTLYNAALLAGLTINERNRHHFCPSYVSPGRDAAVAFSNIDLKFTNPYPFPIKILGRISGDQLMIDFRASHDLPQTPIVYEEVAHVHEPTTFRLGKLSGRSRLRNSGKRGYEVAVFRQIGNRREFISKDEYPAMNKVLESQPDL